MESYRFDVCDIKDCEEQGRLTATAPHDLYLCATHQNEYMTAQKALKETLREQSLPIELAHARSRKAIRNFIRENAPPGDVQSNPADQLIAELNRATLDQ